MARRLRGWPGLLASGDGWADRVLAEAGSLQWLLNGAARMDALAGGTCGRACGRPSAGRSASRSFYPIRRRNASTDRWQVVGQRAEEEDKLRVQRTWLVGERTRRAALCLSFAAGPQQALDVSLIPGTALEAELVFYPSAAPLRATVGTRHGAAGPLGEPAACADFEAAMEHTAGWLAGDPWLESVPWLVRDCLPCEHDERWVLRDGTGRVVPLARKFANPWPLVAVSGGAPVTVCGEWDGGTLLPMSVAVEGRFIPLGGKDT